MFYSNGFKNVSVDDICHAIGIAKKTFYLSYSNKDELVQEFVEAAFSSLYNSLQEKSMPKDVISRLKAFDNHMVEFLKIFYPVLISDLRRYYDESYHIFVDKREKLVAHLAAILDDGKRQGTFRVGIDSRILAELRFNELDTIFSKRAELKIANWNRSHKALFEHYVAGLVLRN